MATAAYYSLLDLLSEHPEFSATEENSCDYQIVNFGKKLWAQWVAEEQKQEALDRLEGATVTHIDQIKSKSRINPVNRKIIEMTLEGKNAAEIARVLPINTKQVYRVRTRYGLATQKRTVQRKLKYNFDPEEVAEVFLSTKKTATTARHFGVSPDTMRKILLRLGLIGGIKFEC